MAQNMASLREMKRRGEPIAMLTCYDYPTAILMERAGIDVLLVGDSVGTNVLGYGSEVEVTLDDIRHHVRAVRRGTKSAYLLADLPYRTYEDEAAAVASARLLVESGADGVKLEGIRPAIVAALRGAGIDVCAHIGLSMQAQDAVAIKGKTCAEAAGLFAGALAVEAAGAQMVVLELVPEELAAAISAALAIPTIGIGAGARTDGQVLVVHDLLGVTPRAMRHARVYLDLPALLTPALEGYRADVRTRAFPAEENLRRMAPGALQEFEGWLRERGQGLP